MPAFVPFGTEMEPAGLFLRTRIENQISLPNAIALLNYQHVPGPELLDANVKTGLFHFTFHRGSLAF